MFNPLDQFQVKNIIEMTLGGYDVSFTNSSLSMAIALLLFVCLLLHLKRSSSYRAISQKLLVDAYDRESEDSSCLERVEQKKLVPRRTAALCEVFLASVFDMSVKNAGAQAKRFVPLIFTVYIFILLCNLIGLVPGLFTATSQIFVTFCIAGFMFIVTTIIGFAIHGLRYFSILLPKGTPIMLMPVMLVIELFTYFIRPISLSLRLAANMTAGHIVLKVMGTFVLMSGLLSFAPFTLLNILMIFEIFIAILQAYIFTILSVVYLNTALNLH